MEEIRGAVNTTVLTTEVGSKAVDAGLHHFEEVTRGFKLIAGLVITTTQAAREIELSTKQQMTAVEQANSAVARSCPGQPGDGDKLHPDAADGHAIGPPLAGPFFHSPGTGGVDRHGGGSLQVLPRRSA